MKTKYLTVIVLTVAFFVFVHGCTGNKTEKKSETESKTSSVPASVPAVIGNETQLLLKDLEENGDYVNSQQYPSLIKASIVFEELGEQNLVIDLRQNDAF